MDVDTWKSQLLESIEHRADFRDEKTAEYPEDDRNEQSAAALRALHRRLAKLPESSPQLVRLAEVWEGAPQDGDALSALSGVEGEVLRTYGFGVRAEDLEAEGDPESFLDHLVSALESELDDQRASS